jgi:hypothetical protein
MGPTREFGRMAARGEEHGEKYGEKHEEEQGGKHEEEQVQ